MDIVSALEKAMTPERKKALQEVLESRTKQITVVLEDIYQPHNASAVLRTCDCFGVQDVHIIENRHKYTVSSNVSLGSSKWLNLHKYNEQQQNTLSCIKKLKSEGYLIIGTSPHAEEGSLEDLDIERPIALLFGTEGPGLSEEAMAAADKNIKIPMVGFTESFNISVSAAIILHHLTWKLRNSAVNWRLSEDEKKELYLSWLKRSVRGSEGIIARLSE
jgi:tRNA (guanosine-2'-O-)-methyltransferase